MVLQFGRTNGQMKGCSLTHGLSPMNWLDDQGHEKSMIGNLMRNTSGKEVCE